MPTTSFNAAAPDSGAASPSRRRFLARTLLAAGMAALGPRMLRATGLADRASKKAQIAISLDLEMMRNFPRWEDTRWDYEKGNLTDQAKDYALKAARLV